MKKICLACGLVMSLAPQVRADLVEFSQDFESLDAEAVDPSPLGTSGWLVFGNVSFPEGGRIPYGYGAFVAPNLTEGFSSISTGQGGPKQGDQGLVVFSDYNNGDHGNMGLIESNVFQQQTIGAADVGSTWRFQFDGKLGDIGGASTAQAFIKTISGSDATNNLALDTTMLPETWGTYTIDITIDEELVGQFLQFGFSNLATNFEPSGMQYDNVFFFNLTPPPAPELIKVLNLERTGENFTITWESEEGVTYDVERAFDLENDVWDFVGDPVVGDASGVSMLTDDTASDGANFYRVRVSEE
jgi:hypothetical protein